ncbi:MULTISPECIES: SpoIIE family protein phosphatase [unclassified Isoptericola]|uniref:ATP-binding SpoIIE family protein phosphatase n=1 Tax=unclassified Isoptericola TaxID=2623355 RepID=UPI0027133C7F|nr:MULTISPECIES: SpoIIE family protein phosphatase [unclassified Isoptericola]MDO8143470.1 SpoIIE family protein phosphatase [Isoptericola sp. 178]MDO8147331.1 SpoIIE family protein phosphatase [Isoptericola sp. b515]MDO8150352.1 SpoIIE family protein phosphatase [Isoptericola sp. b408]
MDQMPGSSADVLPVPASRLAAALSVTTVPAFVTGAWSLGMPVLWVNRAFEELGGVGIEELALLGPNSLLALVEDDPQRTAAQEDLKAGRAMRRIVSTRRSDGGTTWLQVDVTPLPTDHGLPEYWIGVTTDVSEYVDQQAAQLASLEVERRQRADLDLIAQTTDLLGDLEYPFALRDIADLLRSLVPWAGFYVNDDGLLFADGVDVASPPSGRGRRHTRYVPEDRTHDRLEPALTGGVSEVSEPVVDDVQQLLDGAVDGPVRLSLEGRFDPSSAAGWLRRDLMHRVVAETGAVPREAVVHAVAGRRRVLGLLVTWDGDEPVPEPGPAPGLDHVSTVVEVVARRAGTAIDNARLYAREHRLAEALQRAMLPEQADVTGLDVWTYYAPNAEHAQVGGDWYDVLQITDGTVGLVIGDVVGHDVEAAAAMGQLRSVVRAYAYELTTPGTVLDRVDQLVAGMRVPRPASMVYAALQHRTEDDSWGLEYTRAGHLPPLLLRDGTTRLLNGAGGRLVGFGDEPRETGHEVLRRGDVLVFYTDGLIERRDRSLKRGLETLTEMSGRITARDAAGVGEELLSRLADSPEDDVAIVVVRVPDPEADQRVTALSPRSRRWLLPSEPGAIGRARHAVLRTSQAWGLAESAAAELVVSELVANGVLHGWGNIALRLFDTGDGLRIEVEDSNPAPPVATDGHPNRLGGFGMQIVERLADWGWRPSASGKLVWAKLRPDLTSGSGPA